MRQLTGPEMGTLADAIIQSYTKNDFELFLQYRLDKRLELIAGTAANFPFQVYQVIQRANMEFWHHRLIDAFLAERPHFEEIYRLSQSLGVAAGFHQGTAQEPVSLAGVEALVRAADHVSLAEFSNRLQRIERTVGRVELEVNGSPRMGTGFLVGPDLLLSNYHVFADLIERPATVTRAQCRFDYRTEAEGRIAALAATDPVVAASPMSNREGNPELDSDWPADELDYALVRLAEPVGSEPYGPNESGMPLGVVPRDPPLPPRGWIPVEAATVSLEPGASFLFVAQHPKGRPLKFNLGQFLGRDSQNRRLRYATNTDKGSSGSPCFNEQLQWIGLHNYGDPGQWAAPAYNQGITLSAILSHLKSQGFDLEAKQGEWRAASS